MSELEIMNYVVTHHLSLIHSFTHFLLHVRFYRQMAKPLIAKYLILRFERSK